MSFSVKNIKGMPDILPAKTGLWQYVERVAADLLASYGYQEIRMPIVEYTDLFKRSIGEVTDIVEKEMYTFPDRHNDLLTLRPEGTAGCVRACVQNSLLVNQAQQRLWYLGPMFRYENPQKGRQRQFHQLGVETFGIGSAEMDAELIVMGYRLWQKLGIADHVQLQINTIGALASRNAYKKDLEIYLSRFLDKIDADSVRRVATNTLRVLDSKSPDTQLVLEGAPCLHDYIDADSWQHFRQLCSLLDRVGVPYSINQRLVRGLDYYNKTVFEWVTTDLGAQGTICAGGRYDGLVEQLGGPQTPAVGFAIGLERLCLLLETVVPDVAGLIRQQIDVYFVIAVEESMYAEAISVSEKLRREIPELRMITHTGGGSFKSQLKKADKSGASYAMIVGSNEVSQQVVNLKPLRQEYGVEQQVISLDKLTETIRLLIAK